MSPQPGLLEEAAVSRPGGRAHSYRDGRRWWNVRPPEEYLSLVEAGLLPIGGEEHLTQEDERLEEVFLKLRTLEGLPVTSVADVAASVFVEQGLLRLVDDHLVPTERGMLLLNELVLELARPSPDIVKGYDRIGA